MMSPLLSWKFISLGWQCPWHAQRLLEQSVCWCPQATSAISWLAYNSQRRHADPRIGLVLSHEGIFTVLCMVHTVKNFGAPVSDETEADVFLQNSLNTNDTSDVYEWSLIYKTYLDLPYHTVLNTSLEEHHRCSLTNSWETYFASK